MLDQAHGYDQVQVQVQGQPHSLDSAEHDFVVWTLSNMVIIGIPKDAVWSSNISKLDFYCIVFIPYFVKICRIYNILSAKITH